MKKILRMQAVALKTSLASNTPQRTTSNLNGRGLLYFYFVAEFSVKKLSKFISSSPPKKNPTTISICNT